MCVGGGEEKGFCARVTCSQSQHSNNNNPIVVALCNAIQASRRRMIRRPIWICESSQRPTCTRFWSRWVSLASNTRWSSLFCYWWITCGKLRVLCLYNFWSMCVHVCASVNSCQHVREGIPNMSLCCLPLTCNQYLSCHCHNYRSAYMSSYTCTCVV